MTLFLLLSTLAVGCLSRDTLGRMTKQSSEALKNLPCPGVLGHHLRPTDRTHEVGCCPLLAYSRCRSSGLASHTTIT
ncbi:hypothetical protein BDM02DRAFT_3119081, partial [Thelephora ganbajun]